MTKNERLAFLSKWLREHEEEIAEGFDMDAYFHTCGTPACAAGFASTIPEFRKEGFVRNETWLPTFDEEIGLEACRMFFGTREPFDPMTYDRLRISPAEVADRIDSYLLQVSK